MKFGVNFKNSFLWFKGNPIEVTPMIVKFRGLPLRQVFMEWIKKKDKNGLTSPKESAWGMLKMSKNQGASRSYQTALL